jgi:Mn2+/Fe2+ NRAMP family transporter
MGMGLDYAGFNGVKLLFWSAVVNGVLAPPLIMLLVKLTSDSRVMGNLVNPAPLRWAGWISAAVMSLAAVAMLVV